jgi:hypothetical protein
LPLIITIGMPRVSGSWRSARNTANPFMPGITMSRKISAGCSLRASSIASLPSVALSTA